MIKADLWLHIDRNSALISGNGCGGWLQGNGCRGWLHGNGCGGWLQGTVAGRGISRVG